jgi:hypothetical protein
MVPITGQNPFDQRAVVTASADLFHYIALLLLASRWVLAPLSSSLEAPAITDYRFEPGGIIERHPKHWPVLKFFTCSGTTCCSEYVTCYSENLYPEVRWFW